MVSMPIETRISTVAAAVMVGLIISRMPANITLGRVRCSGLDANGLETWERPDGSKVRLPPGARLTRVRGARGKSIRVRQGIRAR